MEEDKNSKFTKPGHSFKSLSTLAKLTVICGTGLVILFAISLVSSLWFFLISGAFSILDIRIRTWDSFTWFVCIFLVIICFISFITLILRLMNKFWFPNISQFSYNFFIYLLQFSVCFGFIKLTIENLKGIEFETYPY